MAKKRRSSQFKDTSQVIDIEEARRKRQEKRAKQQRRTQEQDEAVRKKQLNSRVKAGRRKKNITYAVIILCIIAAIGMSALNIISLKSEYKEVAETNKQLEEQKAELQQELEDSDQKEFVEQEAREQLRMIMPGETVYIVPNLDSGSSSSDKESE